MKLYVWQEVLYDYSPGMIVALAETLEEAIEAARADGTLPVSTCAEMGAKKPEVIRVCPSGVVVDGAQPRVWAVHGGG